MFIRNILEGSLNSANYALSDNSVYNYTIKKMRSTHFISYHLSSVSKNNGDNYLESELDSFSLARQKLISRNFMTQFINKYWQETIFLSISNSLSDNYTNKLKSDGLAVYKNQYKKFLLDFNKALANGRIELSEFTITINQDLPGIKYIWKKGFNFSYPRSLSSILCNKRSPNFPNKVQSFLVKKLKNNEFPIFSVVNRFNQIIISEPSDELIRNKNFVNTIYQWYYHNFLWKKDHIPVYEGLFFINPQDACEYMNYIETQSMCFSKQKDLNIFIGSLDFYYRTVRTSPPKVQFRLIPDLRELGELIYKYKYKENINFHNQQRYGRDYFQGQPIYFIQSVLAKNKQTKQIDLIKYSYNIKTGQLVQPYEAIFMNYETALIAWKKFREQLSYYNLPDTPRVIVYNLEDFLKTCEKNNQIEKRNIVFVPAQETYHFIKQEKNKKSRLAIPQIIASKILYIKVLTTRIIWSLTSRQPVYW